ncbi:MAG: hypothetical protein J5932_02220 [Prevotella sp.]|nr:hypothetical protein [Prevotella sp.]
MRQIIILLAAILLYSCSAGSETKAQTTMNKIYVTIGGQTQSVTLADTQAAQELVARLQNGSLTISLNTNDDFEIWGPLGFSLTTSNRQMTAQAGDVVLYNGSNICLFADTNSWSYTPLGHFDNITENDLRTFLKIGESNISVTLSLTNTTAIRSVSTDATTARKDDIYSLNGQKVENPTKGLYIKNGKKVIL